MKRMGLMIAPPPLSLFVQAAQADWTPAKRLTWTLGASTSPVIAVDAAGHLHAFWQDYSPGNFELYYKKSTDGGDTWTANKRLTWNSGDSATKDVGVDSAGHLYVIWQDNTPGHWEIYFKKSTDGGDTWTASKRLTWSSYDSSAPAIAVDSAGHLHVAWLYFGPSNGEIHYIKSTNGGAAWTPGKKLAGNLGTVLPAIGADSADNLHMFWEDNTPGNLEIYYRKSMDNGNTWTAKKRLTWKSYASQRPDISAYSQGNLHLVWLYGIAGDFLETHYKKSTDWGATWSTSKKLSWGLNLATMPAISVDSQGNPHVVFEVSIASSNEIYYDTSTDGGNTWATSKRITFNSGLSLYPDISVDSLGNLHVVWQDYTPGNWEIYYKRFIK
jgi:BNR repeat-like domain